MLQARISTNAYAWRIASATNNASRVLAHGGWRAVYASIDVLAERARVLPSDVLSALIADEDSRLIAPASER
jgi:hypothetical protein